MLHLLTAMSRSATAAYLECLLQHAHCLRPEEAYLKYDTLKDQDLQCSKVDH